MSRRQRQFSALGGKKNNGGTVVKYQDGIPATFKIGCMP